MSIMVGIIVVLVGKLFTKFENNQFDLIFWIIIVVTMMVIIAEAVIIYNISKKTKEIKDL